MELKYLDEQRADNQNKMQAILDEAKSEKRALSEEKIAEFNKLKKLIGEIDATINAEEETREMDIKEKNGETVKATKEAEDKETQKEERAFIDYIVSGEERANSPGMSYGSNGAIVPTTIAKKIMNQPT